MGRDQKQERKDKLASGITNEEGGRRGREKQMQEKMGEKVVHTRGPQTQSAPNTDEPRKSRKSQKQTKKKEAF